MDLESRKRRLINGITRNIDKDMFDEMLEKTQEREGDSVGGYRSYDEFVRKQEEIINQFNEDSIRTLEVLKELTTRGRVYIDSERSLEYEPLNFFLGRNGYPIFLTYYSSSDSPLSSSLRKYNFGVSV